MAGSAAAAELHLVHAAESGELAVVGVLLIEGTADHAGLAPVIDDLPAEPGPARTIGGVQVDATALVPPDQRTYRYDGSLTTPPCSEGVRWVLMTEPLALSADQLATLGDVLEGSARPAQPVNDREVEEDAPSCRGLGRLGDSVWREARRHPAESEARRRCPYGVVLDDQLTAGVAGAGLRRLFGRNLQTV